MARHRTRDRGAPLTASRRARLATATLLLAVTTAPATAQQGPTLHVAFASSAHRGGAPAIAWLCEQLLPSLPAWPDGLDRHDRFALLLTPNALEIRATDVALPEDTIACGALRLADDGSGPPLLFRCDVRGVGDWTVPAAFVLPDRHRRLLDALAVREPGTPRTLHTAVLVGHLAGALDDRDPRAQLLGLVPSLCGDTTWTFWPDEQGLRVRGRSAGGLMLPLVAVLAATADPAAPDPSGLSLRAFCAADDDTTEAARQLGRSDRELDTDTLRRLLRGDDAVRLAAIDALRRRGAVSELPHIIAAADADRPWATSAALHALETLWPDATEQVRRATTAAIARSDNRRIRGVDLRGTPAKTPHDDGRSRAHALLLLLCAGVGVLGLWWRERARAAASR